MAAYLLWSEVLERTGIPRRTLAQMRADGAGPPAFWLTPAKLAVWEADLDRWMRARPRSLRAELYRSSRNTPGVKRAKKPAGDEPGGPTLSTTTTTIAPDSKRRKANQPPPPRQRDRPDVAR